MVKAILGRKLRMTQLFQEDGKVLPLTAIEVGPCPIVQIKNEERDGYCALQIGFLDKKEKNTTQPLLGHFKKADCGPKRVLREIRVESADGFEVGQALDASAFDEGDRVDVSGVSKGRGFQGGVRRHNWGGGRKTHGSMFHRAIGSIGPGSGLSRVVVGKTLPGHMGHEKVTVQNLEVVRVDKENGVLFVKGGIPGPDGSVVFVKATTKNQCKKS